MTIPKIGLYLKKVYNTKFRPIFLSGGNYNCNEINAGSEYADKGALVGCGDPEAAKEDHAQVPMVQFAKQEEEDRRSAAPVQCALVMLILLVMAFVACGLMLYQQYARPVPRRYSGFCSVPIQQQSIRDYNDLMSIQAESLDGSTLEHRVVPLHWSTVPDVRVFTFDSEAETPVQDDALHEEFDVGGRLESIKVFDNGRTVTFIHDFDDNVTGIVDEDRCFMMDLDPFVVLPPEMLVLGMEQGSEFDITRVRSTLKAMLPALQDIVSQARALVNKCMDKPTYRLQKEVEESGIRKRSVDAPPHDYMQFAGRRVQEIQISNLADLLQQEDRLRLR